MIRHDVLLLLVLLLTIEESCTSSPSASGDADIALDDFNARFHSWNPLKNSRLKIARGNDGNGVYAAPRRLTTSLSSSSVASSSSVDLPVRNGEILMTIPMNESLCRESLGDAEKDAHRHGKTHYYSTIKSLRDEQLIPAALMIELALGEAASTYYYWLRFLPSEAELTPPFTWSSEELSHVEPRSLRRQQTGRSAMIQQDYMAVKRLLPEIKKYLVQTLGGNNIDQKVRFEAFRLCVLWTWTRAWNMHGHKYLVPAADMFNHAPDDDERQFSVRQMPSASFRSSKFTEFHDVTSGAFAVRSDRSFTIRGGEQQQVYESYGDNMNDIYFGFHGFVPSSNTYDCEPMSLEADHKKGGTSPAVLRELLEVMHRKAAGGRLPDGALPAQGRPCCVYKGSVPPQLLLLAYSMAIGSPSFRNALSTDSKHTTASSSPTPTGAIMASCLSDGISQLELMSSRDRSPKPFFAIGYKALDVLVRCATGGSSLQPVTSTSSSFDDRTLFRHVLEVANATALAADQVEEETNRLLRLLELSQLAMDMTRSIVLGHYKAEFSTSNSTLVAAMLQSNEAEQLADDTSLEHRRHLRRISVALRLRLGRMRILNGLLAWVKAQKRALSEAAARLLPLPVNAEMGEDRSEL